jgi:hypothetical protein
VKAASDLLVLWNTHLELHRRRRCHFREGLQLGMEGGGGGGGGGDLEVGGGGGGGLEYWLFIV